MFLVDAVIATVFVITTQTCKTPLTPGVKDEGIAKLARAVEPDTIVNAPDVDNIPPPLDTRLKTAVTVPPPVNVPLSNHTQHLCVTSEIFGTLMKLHVAVTELLPNHILYVVPADMA